MLNILLLFDWKINAEFAAVAVVTLLVSDCVTLWTADSAPLSMGFFKQVLGWVAIFSCKGIF